ncbi:MAG: hypothetical protein ABUK08_08320, partial [Candidatus Humimicrobiaceae bacterium]
MELKSRKSFIGVCAVVVIMIMILVLFVGCKTDPSSKELTVFVWEGYLPEVVVDMFEEFVTMLKHEIKKLSGTSLSESELDGITLAITIFLDIISIYYFL